VHIWVPFSWTQMTLKVKSGVHLELQQGTGLPWTDFRLWGTKGLFIRPRCIGTIRVQVQMLTIIIIIIINNKKVNKVASKSVCLNVSI